MKKHAIAIIVLVFAVLCALGSCSLKDIIKSGGTIIVTNGYPSPMLIAVG